MAMSITVAVSAPIQAGLPAPLAGGETKLAGVLPAVESAMLRELIRAGVSDRVVLIEAATNGHLTLARVSFTYSLARSPEPLVALLLRATAIARASLASSPSLDQVHLSGFYQEQGPFDGNRRDATFTAAYRRQDLPGLPNLTRMWMHPALEQANPDALASRAARSAEIARLGVQLETQPAFSGTEGETSADLERRLEGLKRGGLRIGVLYRGSPKQRDLALTFDDGPEPLYTTLLLDTLSRLGLKATFFLIGERVEQFPYLARDIVEAGHELGNHSFHHRNLTRLEPVQVDEELQSTQVAIERATGVTPRFFRPPGGRYNATTLRVAAARRLITIFWTDDPGDYLLFRERVLKMRLLGRVGNGGILLLHTGVDQTIQVLPEATQVLRDRGYALGPVSTLLRTAP
jgi:peptidoglycan/xylan/chitin deacetylase (PgdA/CDA1 family)